MVKMILRCNKCFSRFGVWEGEWEWWLKLFSVRNHFKMLSYRWDVWSWFTEDLDTWWCWAKPLDCYSEEKQEPHPKVPHKKSFPSKWASHNLLNSSTKPNHFYNFYSDQRWDTLTLPAVPSQMHHEP